MSYIHTYSALCEQAGRIWAGGSPSGTGTELGLQSWLITMNYSGFGT